MCVHTYFGSNKSWFWLALVAPLLLGCGAARVAPASPSSASGRGSAESAEAPPITSAALSRGAALDRRALIRGVLRQNPSVASARHAYRASRARQPQADALPDPMLGYEFAPLSIFSSNVRYGQTVRLSQRFPWPGKLARREDAAEARAEARQQEIEVVQLDLALEASDLFDDYWLIDRSLEVNAAHRKLLAELGASARAQYGVGRGSLQDPLQAELELTNLEREQLALHAAKQLTAARINTLLRRPPQAALPPAPKRLRVARDRPAPSNRLQLAALRDRAELKARGAEVRAAQAEIAAADREYYPDVTVMGSYSSMWKEVEHQFMLGVELPVPLQRATRAGAVDEANAKAAAARSEVRRAADRVRREVEEARLLVLEALDVVKLYDERLLPVVQSQLDAARSGYGSGQNDFAALIQAEKNLRGLELERYTALSELSKRRARLERSLGRMPGSLGRER